MHCACSQGHLEAVEVLIGLGAYVDSQDSEGNTPLHVTTRNRYTAIAQLLLKVGANTELTDEVSDQKWITLAPTFKLYNSKLLKLFSICGMKSY